MKRCPTVWSVDYRSGTVGYKSTWPMTIGKRRISGVALNVDRERMLVNRDICVLVRKARKLVRTNSINLLSASLTVDRSLWLWYNRYYATNAGYPVRERTWRRNIGPGVQANESRTRTINRESLCWLSIWFVDAASYLVFDGTYGE